MPNASLRINGLGRASRSEEADAVRRLATLTLNVFDIVTAQPEEFIGEQRVAVNDNVKALEAASQTVSNALSLTLAKLFGNTRAAGHVSALNHSAGRNCHGNWP